jgi:ASC-1-like (ASCH) protein
VGGKFRGGLFQDAKFAWYKKYTGQEWDGMEPTYKKAINVVKANEVLAPARIAAEERRRLRGDAEAMFKVVSKGAARIPLDSMKAYLTENKVVEENQIEKLVAEVNTNSDREIDLDEFCNGWHKMQKGAGSSSSSGGGGALKSSGGGGALKSDSALLQDTIAKQEAALKEQQKKIEELQAKLKAKG